MAFMPAAAFWSGSSDDGARESLDFLFLQDDAGLLDRAAGW